MKLWIAQGFGVGRIPLAPGTFGSLIGLAWVGLLLAYGNVWTFLLATVFGFFVSVWLCGAAEVELGQKDPGSVVLDEIVAMPVCFASWLGIHSWQAGAFPRIDLLFLKANWLPAAGIFLAFRIFDVWKPWPVRQSQALPGGWGVTIDDLLAAIYVNLLVLATSLLKV